MGNNVGKKDLWRYVNRKLNYAIHRFHVYAVLSILFEEMVRDLQQGKSIDIPNLGKISLRATKPRKYYHVHLQKVVLSASHRLIKIILAPRVRNKLIQFLDVDKTFSGD